jgi:hypothetical protein
MTKQLFEKKAVQLINPVTALIKTFNQFSCRPEARIRGVLHEKKTLVRPEIDSFIKYVGLNSIPEKLNVGGFSALIIYINSIRKYIYRF